MLYRGLLRIGIPHYTTTNTRQKGGDAVLDEILERALDTSLERFSRWFAPWRVRLKRGFLGFRVTIIAQSIRQTAAVLFNKVKAAGREGGFLQRLISEPVEPVGEATLRETADAALSRVQTALGGKAFSALLLMTMQCALLIAARGTAELAVLAAFFALHWLACAMDTEYAPISGGVRQRYLAAIVLRAGAYLTLLLSYFVTYAQQGLAINVLLQGTMALYISAHAILYVSFVAFNKRQQLFLRALCGVLGVAPALAGAAGVALGAATIAQEPLIAVGGVLRALGVTLAFIAWQVEMIDTLGGGRLRFGRLWHDLFSTIGFFMMLLGAWLCAL